MEASGQVTDAVGLFERLDSDKSGSLSASEIRAGLAARGLPCSPRDLARFFAQADMDGDGLISRREFKQFCAVQQGHVRAVYNALDTDGDGRITSGEIKRAASALGFSISSHQLRSLMARLDADADGAISYEELREFLLLLPAVNPVAFFESLTASVLVDHAQSEMTPPAEVSYASSAGGALAQPPSLAAQLAGKLYAGGVAGAISRTATAPIDRLKMVMQAAPPAEAAKGMGGALRRIWAEGGALAFLRGNGANVLKIAPETSIKFVAFEQLKRSIAADPSNASVPERFAAGGAAGAIAQATIYPLEIAKTRLAISAPGTYSGILQCLRQVASSEGPLALYGGLATSIVGIVPYAGIDLAANSMLRERVSAYYAAAGEEPSVSAVLGCGMASSTIAMLGTYPLNLVRTRLQASGMPGSPRFDGAMDCLRKTVAEGGMRALYQGLLPNMLKVLPATSISYAVYDRLASGSRQK